MFNAEAKLADCAIEPTVHPCDENGFLRIATIGVNHRNKPGSLDNCFVFLRSTVMSFVDVHPMQFVACCLKCIPLHLRMENVVENMIV